MVNKVTFVGFRGGDCPNLSSLDPTLAAGCRYFLEIGMPLFERQKRKVMITYEWVSQIGGP